jgi:hypothetical protein
VGCYHSKLHEGELFLSADPLVQAPYNTQSYNRYSYTFNNPLSYTDPSGYQTQGYCPRKKDSDRCPAGDEPPTEEVRVVGEDTRRDRDYQNEQDRKQFIAETQATSLANMFAADVNLAMFLGQVELNGSAIAQYANGSAVAVAATAGGGVVVGGAQGGGASTALEKLKNLGKVGSRLSGPLAAMVLALTPTKMGDATIAGNRDQMNKLHRGRIQAQGGGLERSVPWAQSTPPTVAQGLAMLQELRMQLTDKQFNERARSFERAERYIINAGAGGGAYPPGNSFKMQGTTDIRVDIEIQSGAAFVP